MTWHLLYGTICTVYGISPTIYDITTLCPLHQSIISHIKLIISDSISTVSLSSHQDYGSYNPHCMYDNTGTICADIIWIHMTSHPLFKISHHAMTFTHTVFMSSHPGYLSLHPLLLSYYLQCIDYTTSAICVFSNPLYVWHHMNSMWHHNCSLWHHKTVFMTSHPQYSWHHTHCIRHDTHSTCDITATVIMTRHLLCFWHYTQCIWHLTWWMNGNTRTVSDMIPILSV